MTDQAKIKALNKHFSEVLCPGCGQVIKESDGMSRIQYVRTKRATDVFFHAECFRLIRNRRAER